MGTLLRLLLDRAAGTELFDARLRVAQVREDIVGVLAYRSAQRLYRARA